VGNRQPPIDPNGYYHVGTRGSFGRPLFREDGERELFLDLYHRWSVKFGWRTLAWVLMDNHHHFLVRLIDGDLTTGMRVLHSGFARRMNVKYAQTRKGHMVRHCFYAGHLETEDVIKRVARYIDLNPVRAGICAEPEEWPWSSYRAAQDQSRPRPFHHPYDLLELFDGDPSEARRAYRNFVHESHALEDHVLSSDDGDVVESVA
jgi:putative transposase